MRERQTTREDAAKHEGVVVIALVDYGAGNLTSVRKALSALGAEFTTPATPAALNGASAVIVPGVGHFAATSALDEPWREAIGAAARTVDSLGHICRGMTWGWILTDSEVSLVFF